MSVSLSATADNQSAVRGHLIAQFYRVLPLAIGAGGLLAAAIAAVLWRHADTPLLALWLGVLVSTKLVRLYDWHCHRALSPDDLSGQLSYLWRMRAGALAGGSAWAASCFLAFPATDIVLQMLLFLMLAGVSAAAVTSMATDRVAALLFQGPIAIAVATRSALASEPVHNIIFGMALLYHAFIVAAALRLYRQDLETTAIRLHALQREYDLRDSELRYRRLAHTDSLTSLPNRASLSAQLPELLQGAAAQQVKVALFYVDVDNFKDINDSHGHGFGDQFLTEMAHRLRENVRPDDLVVRMGGDEFVIVIMNPREPSDMEALASRLLANASLPVATPIATVQSSISIGIAVYPDDGANMQELLVNADIALYQAKNRGRGLYAHYSASMSASFNERRTLEVSLRQALGSQQLFVEFQPVVRIEGTIPVGLEALVRWRHPERGLLSPGVFVPIAERCGMEDLLGEHVLRAACRQLRQWLNDMVPVVPVAINVSPRQFERGRLIDTIERITREFDIDPALLTIELTESALMQHALQNLTTLGKLRDLGVRVAIDDFGTGYSSLAYLKNLPIDSIKIDRSFVNDITRDRRDSNIIQAIVGIGASLGIRVVAEGVETVEQSKILRQLGCTIAQGYLYHRPMSAAACTDLLMSMPAHIDPSDTIPTRRLDMSESELGG